jgi:hypothetical protein
MSKQTTNKQSASKQTTNKQSASKQTTPVATPEQIKSDLESEIAALDAQIESATRELEAKRQKLAEARVAVAIKITAAQKQIEAELIEKKISEFVAVAAALDHAMTVEAMAAFKRLASELSIAGPLKQAHAARQSLIARMLGQTVYRMPFPTWSAMAQAWLIPAKEKAA